MSVTLNSTTGVVQYSADMANLANIVSADLICNAATALNTATGDVTTTAGANTNVAELAIPVGKGERLLLNYHLLFTHGAAAGVLNYRIALVNAADWLAATRVRTELSTGTNNYTFRQAQERWDNSSSVTSPGTGGTGGLLTTPTNTSITLGTAGTEAYAQSRVIVQGSSTTNGILVFNYNAASSTVTLKAGSYVEYRKF